MRISCKHLIFFPSPGCFDDLGVAVISLLDESHCRVSGSEFLNILHLPMCAFRRSPLEPAAGVLGRLKSGALAFGSRNLPAGANLEAEKVTLRGIDEALVKAGVAKPSK